MLTTMGRLRLLLAEALKGEVIVCPACEHAYDPRDQGGNGHGEVECPICMYAVPDPLLAHDDAELLGEEGANHSYPGQPVARNVLSPDINNREQLGAISAKGIDTVDDPDHMPDHLTTPTVDPEDCYGPVPPDAEPPYVGQDPLVRDAAPQPFSGGGSIRRG